jgi:hypothetical protein
MLAIDEALMGSAIRAVLGVESGDRLDRFFDVDRKDR